MVVDFPRLTDLGDPAVIHDHYPVAQGHCFGLIVCHINGGDAQTREQCVDFQAQGVAQLGVERGQRFVEQERPRTHGQRAGKGHALPLTAGKLINLPVGEGLDSHQCEHFADAGTLGGRGFLAQAQAVADVLGDAHVGKERVGLEDHADVALLDRQGRDIHAIKQHTAPGVRHFQSGNHAQGRSLATAGRAEQHHGFPGMDGKIQRIQGLCAVREGFGALFEFNGQGLDR